MAEYKPSRPGMVQPESQKAVYTAEMGQPPQDIDSGSVTPEPKKSKPKADPREREATMSRGRRYAKGGKIDGCAQRGHTKGRMV